MDIKKIIRKNKIDLLIGSNTLTEKEKQLLSYLNTIFENFHFNEYVYVKNIPICICYTGSKQLYLNNCIEDEICGQFEVEYVVIRNSIKDFLKYKFNVDIETIYLV
jgi:hypothetical protein